MKKAIRTKPNILRIVLSLLIVLIILCYIGLLAFLLISVSLNEGQGTMIYFCFLVSIMAFIGILFIKVIFSRISWVEADYMGVRIHYPFKFKTVDLNWKEIKGYSKSDFYYGYKPSFKTQSLLFYSREKGIFEVIKMYNRDFIDFQTKLRKFDIICFGKEGFRTKTVKKFISKRDYKYEGYGE
jgi:hypothetical protein